MGFWKIQNSRSVLMLSPQWDMFLFIGNWHCCYFEYFSTTRSGKADWKSTLHPPKFKNESSPQCNPVVIILPLSLRNNRLTLLAVNQTSPLNNHFLLYEISSLMALHGCISPLMNSVDINRHCECKWLARNSQTARWRGKRSITLTFYRPCTHIVYTYMEFRCA